MGWYEESLDIDFNGEMTSQLRAKILDWGAHQGYVCWEYGDEPCWVRVDLPSLRVMPGVYDSYAAVSEFTSSLKGDYFVACRYRLTRVSNSRLASVQGKLTEWLKKRDAFLAEVAPWNRTSKSLTCKRCGKRLYCDDLRKARALNCTCGELLLSPTNKERLGKFNARIKELQTELDRVRQGTPTSKTAWYVECCFRGA